MKPIVPILSILLFASCANAKDISYTGSTPAHSVVRSFLGIPLKDSIDFIRWKVTLADNRYKLQCNYGISKPNTNGFINGGVKIELDGELKKDNNYYQFTNDSRVLRVVAVNEDLLHLLDTDNKLLAGNGGWSYTLNNTAPAGLDQLSLIAGPGISGDSLSFEGRTPCNIPNVVPKGTTCYKLKWHVVLYNNAQTNQPTTYRANGTPWRKEGGRTGNWKIVTGTDGRTIYKLYDENGNDFLFLLKLDDNILVFTDAQGKLLVGDEDFSYTLNRDK